VIASLIAAGVLQNSPLLRTNHQSPGIEEACLELEYWASTLQSLGPSSSSIANAVLAEIANVQRHCHFD
jgi:hypothetical protein